MAGRHVFARPRQGRAEVRYYGYYSNISRGKRQKKQDGTSLLTTSDAVATGLTDDSSG